ncbi:MAG: SH3 domain-containing protein [Leptolyngbyaceae cyanobacterium SM1_1_3]|nr:SH3 domain-containing protein [Leptolyngbyaceae cyanobacterium SM1_1_3]NJN04578.1 SH3 domain-containing protein [Leptolyngbyaceae cyanobacterium RM1_1_2]NJO11422.1 SH3 domain-containing protein [Leptolyngbyaceae cyanobacterium SL_1_1]
MSRYQSPSAPCPVSWKLPFFILLTGIISGLGQQARADEGTQPLAQVVRGCEFDGFPKYYSRVTTNEGDPLIVRQTPAGRPIGSVPDGWAVVVLEWTRNGVWARVTSHFGVAEEDIFDSAPYFREGWVSAAYLKDLGRFCSKPEGVVQLLQPEFAEHPVEVQGDWLAWGDALAQAGANTDNASTLAIGPQP